MNKKIKINLIVLLLFVVSLTGCNESPEVTKRNDNTNNLFPIGIISGPKEAFFGDTINFDASESYDSDGSIVSYTWDFGDGNIANGKIVTHAYNFENDYDIDYPLIYTISLFVKDDQNSISAIGHQIKIFPNNYIFYLTFDQITLEKPPKNKEKIRLNGIFNQNSPIEIQYDLVNELKIDRCKFNVTIYLEKPFITFVKKIYLSLYDNNNNEIKKIEDKLGINRFWKEKIIQLNGKIDEKFTLKSLKITIFGFSIINNINILYGGEKSSNICFDFTINNF